jgi:predicted RNA-binding Zn-ribbon protein involved in translation (DUF1610 family)
MELIFVCPTQNGTFASTEYTIMENHGVSVDSSGNKSLDASIGLNGPCPFCGEKHIYKAAELACPFEARQTSEASKEPPMKEKKEMIKLTQTVTGSG